LAQAEESIQRIIEELQRDPRVVRSGMRPLRATGPAVAAAVTMLENTFPNTGAHIMVFMGGPATQGPGQIVGEELKETIRSHHDLVKESAKYVGKSAKFYQGLAERAAKNGHAVDLFGVSLDQVGFLEMGSLSKKTGGVVVMSDTFEHEIFRKSLQKMFEKDADGNLKLAFNSTLEVFTSREVKVMGAIGHMSSLNKKQPNVSENELGIGGTSAWKICSFDPNSTFAVYFDVVATAANPIPRGQNAMVQFHTLYHLSSGQPVLRVTTLAYGYADPSGGPAAVLAGVDQEACAALMARVAVWRGENDDPAPIKWLDRQLIRVMARYGEYRKGEISSFQIPATINLYPQFMFHLRRGLLIQVFGSSPDETVFFRHCALRENVPNTLVMIQPTLDAYSFDSEPIPVMLSVTSIQPNRILLLDTFFHVVIFHGETVAAWRKAGYHEKPEYANLKELLAAPQDDAKDMLETRFPHPIFVDCDQGGSQARFILAILDPAVTHMTNAVPGQPSNGSGGVIFTEDISMKSFMDALKKRAVDYEQ
jgi:protein transport protein SEC23